MSRRFDSVHRIRTTLLSVALVLAGVAPAFAKTYFVDRFDDSLAGACTTLGLADCGLRGAILAANLLPGADTIRLRSGTYELARTTGTEAERGDLDVTEELTIVGVGPLESIIDANGIDRVFDVAVPFDPDEWVRLERLGIRAGALSGADSEIDTVSGAGVRVSSGNVWFELCDISGNAAEDGWGGGVWQAGDGEVFFNRSVIRGNSASDGGAVRGEEVTLESCAVFANVTAYGGAVSITDRGWIALASIGLNTVSALCDGPEDDCGGVVVGAEASTATIAYSTLVANGGHQFVSLVPGAGQQFPPVTLFDTIVVGTCRAPEVEGIHSYGGNIESPGDTCLLGAEDLIGVADAGVSPVIEYHGGPTPVFMPLEGSPAIDLQLITDNCAGEDQRGAVRSLDGDGVPPLACDSGAVELQGPGDLFVENFESGLLSNWWAPNP